MSNAFVFKKVISANSDSSFFKGIIVESKSMTKLPTNCTGIMLNNISDNVKQIFNSVLVNSCSKIGI